MQKYMLLVFLTAVLTSACQWLSPDSSNPSRSTDTEEGEGEGALSLRSEGGAESPVPANAASFPSDGAGPLEKGRFVSLEDAERRVNLARMCDFKNDHIVETVSFSGPNITIKGSEEPAEVGEIIKKRTWKDLLSGNLRADFERAGRQALSESPDRIVAVYLYDREEKYGYWCPPEEEQKECIVQVIYNGSIQPRDDSEQTDGEGFLSDWRYTGDLRARIHFSRRVLSFHHCSSDTFD